jgi:hypothetical protein
MNERRLHCFVNLEAAILATLLLPPPTPTSQVFRATKTDFCAFRARIFLRVPFLETTTLFVMPLASYIRTTRTHESMNNLRRDMTSCYLAPQTPRLSSYSLCKLNRQNVFVHGGKITRRFTARSRRRHRRIVCSLYSSR